MTAGITAGIHRSFYPAERAAGLAGHTGPGKFGSAPRGTHRSYHRTLGAVGAFAAALVLNGTIKSSLTVSAPAAADVLDCPNGQRATLTAVTWSDVSIADLTSGAFLDLPGTFSFGSPVD